MLESARLDLLESGRRESADYLTAVWEVCFGGCPFEMCASEKTASEYVSKLLFSSRPSVSMLIKGVSRQIKDPILREEVRKISKNFSQRFS
jgi:hypothetical protein